MICRFCGGVGCLSCDTIKSKEPEDERMTPIFTAQRDNPDDMEALGFADFPLWNTLLARVVAG